jgi:peroxiredoxin Q/BCP
MAKKMSAQKAPAKKPAAKKAPAKKPAAKKVPAKKVPAKKAVAKKPAAKKLPAKKTAAKKPAAKKAPAKKTAAKKPATKKAPAKKTTAKKAPASRASGKSTAAKAPPKKKSLAKKVAERIADVAVAFVDTVTGTDHPSSAVALAVAPDEPEISVTDSVPAPPTPAADGNALLPVHESEDAPDFTLKADDGSTVSLHDLHGKNVVLYFYPRDNTPGCTLEARDFSQLIPEFEAKNAVVLGVSTDDIESHQHFKKTCELSLKLLADPEKTAHAAYGTWREKNMYGRTVWGTARTTFLIDENGKIKRIWPKVKVEDHALDVLNAL